MASLKTLISIYLIAFLILLSESLPTSSAAVHGGASNSLDEILRRNILQTMDHHQVDHEFFLNKRLEGVLDDLSWEMMKLRVHRRRISWAEHHHLLLALCCLSLLFLVCSCEWMIVFVIICLLYFLYGWKYWILFIDEKKRLDCIYYNIYNEFFLYYSLWSNSYFPTFLF